MAELDKDLGRVVANLRDERGSCLKNNAKEFILAATGGLFLEDSIGFKVIWGKEGEKKVVKDVALTYQ